MGLSWAQMFIKIRFLNSLPSVFGGLKVGMTLAVIGAVVGEFIGAEAGLGALAADLGVIHGLVVDDEAYFLRGHGRRGHRALVGVLLFWLIEAVERLSIPWHETHAREREKLL